MIYCCGVSSILGVVEYSLEILIDDPERPATNAGFYLRIPLISLLQ
jgi:hypothetical protein